MVKQAIKFAVALGLLVVMGAGVVVMAVIAAWNAVAWVVGM